MALTSSLSPTAPIPFQLNLAVPLPLGVVFEEVESACICVEIDPEGNAAGSLQVGDVLRVRLGRKPSQERARAAAAARSGCARVGRTPPRPSAQSCTDLILLHACIAARRRAPLP